MPYKYTNRKGIAYFLHSTVATLRGGGRQQVIYYFSKVAKENGLESLPAGFEVVENPKTGLPCLRKSK